MSILLFTVGKTTAVAGLSWREVVPREGMNERRAMVEMAARNGSKYSVLHRTQDERLLLGMLPDNVDRRAARSPSAAMWLRASVYKPTLFVQQVKPGMYWIVAIHATESEGQLELDPRTDKVMIEDQAKDLIDEILSEYLASGVELEVFTPTGGSPRAAMFSRFPPKHAELAQLVAGQQVLREFKPQQLRGIKPAAWMAVAAIALLAVLGAVITIYIKQLEAKKRLEAELAPVRAQMQAAMIKTITDARIAQAVIASLALDTESPPPDAVLAACRLPLDMVGLYAAGWRVTTVECDPIANKADVIFEATRLGTNYSLDTWAVAHLGMHVNINPDGQHAGITLPVVLPGPRPAMKPPELPRARDILMSYGTRFQMMGMAQPTLQAKVGQATPKSILFRDPAKDGADPAQRMSPAPPEKVYRTGVLQINGTSLSSQQGFEIGAPFVRVDKVTYRVSPASIVWNVEATYVCAQ